MIVVTAIPEVRRILKNERTCGKRIGVVPTMGALHQGHLSLVQRIKPHCDFVVMWLFLNPTQFNSAEDYEKYPRVLDKDCKLAASEGVDLVFAPAVEEIYPGGLEAYKQSKCCRVFAGNRSWGLCGAKRAGHFDGVVHIVSILFNILQPDVAVFGEKDYQQLKVLQQLVEDLHYEVQILAAPLIRDESGLALSSRNELLGSKAQSAAIIYQAMCKAQELLKRGERNTSALVNEVRGKIEQAGLKVDYVEICDPVSLKPLESILTEAQLLVAAFAGNVRLIDNTRLAA